MQIRSAAGKLRGYAAFWLDAFGQPAIDVTLRTHEGLITRIVESPGKSLSEDELARLVAQLRIVAGKTLAAGDLTYEGTAREHGIHLRDRVCQVLRADEAHDFPVHLDGCGTAGRGPNRFGGSRQRVFR